MSLILANSLGKALQRTEVRQNCVLECWGLQMELPGSHSREQVSGDGRSMEKSRGPRAEFLKLISSSSYGGL